MEVLPKIWEINQIFERENKDFERKLGLERRDFSFSKGGNWFLHNYFTHLYCDLKHNSYSITQYNIKKKTNKKN